MYFLTFFATKISLKLADVSDIVYRSKWYKSSLKTRVNIQFLIQATQKPRYFTGFQIIHCNLETFAKASNMEYFHFIYGLFLIFLIFVFILAGQHLNNVLRCV